MHMGPKKYRHCPNVWVEDACKVLGCGFNVKGAIGDTIGWRTPANNNTHLSSVFIVTYTTCNFATTFI